jgi:glycosyltransferase involved in cell wall biosynthesis
METPLNPLISVGIPTYNGAKYLVKAIQSVLNQSYTNLEIIISDNCSTDGTAAIVTQLQQQDKRIKYVLQSSNIGFIKNFNSIPGNASADYIIYFADDDIYDKDFIKLLWQEFIKNPEITLAIGSVKLITPDEKEIEHVNNFTGAKTECTVHLKPVDRIARIIRYGHNREWSWGINLALHKKATLQKHPYSSKMIDPGTLFYRSIVYEGHIGFNGNAIFYKRTGGLSGSQNYGRTNETLKTKYDDVKNEVLQLLTEFKIMWVAKLPFKDKIKLTGVFLRYRFPELLKRNFLFIVSFFSFLLVKKPLRFIKTLINKKG